jgi:hypothetical protein
MPAAFMSSALLSSSFVASSRYLYAAFLWLRGRLFTVLVLYMAMNVINALLLAWGTPVWVKTPVHVVLGSKTIGKRQKSSNKWL